MNIEEEMKIGNTQVLMTMRARENWENVERR